MLKPTITSTSQPFQIGFSIGTGAAGVGTTVGSTEDVRTASEWLPPGSLAGGGLNCGLLGEPNQDSFSSLPPWNSEQPCRNTLPEPVRYTTSSRVRPARVCLER